MTTDEIINLDASGWGAAEILTEIQHRMRLERWQAADVYQNAIDVDWARRQAEKARQKQEEGEGYCLAALRFNEQHA